MGPGWGQLHAEPTNVIFFIGDGMGFEQVKAANHYIAEPLAFEGFADQAECTTYSADSTVTDSAAAATAMATSYKVNNDVVSVAIPGDGSDLEALPEYFRRVYGKSTGLVTTTHLTHATPAAFGAHEPSRSNYVEIAGDYLSSKPNVLFGGGGWGLSVDSTLAAGYIVATDATEFSTLDTTHGLISAQFGADHLPYVFDYLDQGTPYPFALLPDMVTKALDALEEDPDGLFLMVEGGRIDHACHVNDLPRAIYETLAFSDSVQAALDWASGRSDTLILVTADHETGGLLVSGGADPNGYPTVSWSSTGHTSANVPVYAWGQNAGLVYGAMDNTDLYYVCTSDGGSIERFADSDMPVRGTVVGSYIDTHRLDGITETIIERSSGGKPSRRYSVLEHKWTFEIQPGPAVTLFAEVTASASDDGDAFAFAWSPDDIVYYTMFTVDDTSTSAQSYSLDPSTAGTVYVRVVDTDHSAGTSGALDTISVDQILIRTDVSQGDPPGAPSDLVASAISSSEISLGWVDNATDEYGFRVQRLSGAEWVVIATLTADSTGHIDGGLEPETLYSYRVVAFNGSGSSAPSNEVSATTQEGTGIELTANGYKAKGVRKVDLTWSGALGSQVHIYRDASWLATSPNSGSYTDMIGKKGESSYLYQVCETDTSDCSNVAQVNF